MADAPVLRVIEGGLSPALDTTRAPDVPPQILPDRLTDAASGFSPTRLFIAAAISMALHAGAIFWGMYVAPDGEQLAEGGTETEEIIEGVAFISEDAYQAMIIANLPEVEALTEAQLAEAVDEPMEVTKAEAVEADLVQETLPPESATIDAAEVWPDEIAQTEPAEAPDAIPAETAYTAASDIAGIQADDSPAALAPDDPGAVLPNPAIIADTIVAPAISAPDAVTTAESDAALSAETKTPIASDDAPSLSHAFEVATPVEDAAAPDEDSLAAAPADTPLAPTLAPDATMARIASDTITSDDGAFIIGAEDADAAAPVEDLAEMALPAYDDAPVAMVDDQAETASFTDEIIIAAVDITPGDEPKPAAARPRQARPAPKPPRAPAQRAAQSAAASTPSVAQQAARGPRQGTAGAGGRSNTEHGREQLSSYQAKLVAQLRRYRQYPSAARSRNLRGTAVITFTVNASGAVTRATLAKSSGHAILDEAAVQLVHRASPFPPIPREIGRNSLTISAPVRFDTR